MDYNTNREKLIMPEYGRHIQKMIEHVKQIPDREKRNEQIRAVVSVMEILNPHLTEQPDYKHKLWDHVQFIAGFDLDVDSPYPMPTKEEFSTPPEIVPMPKEQGAAGSRPLRPQYPEYDKGHRRHARGRDTRPDD